jgi:anti-sigma B factor antagonist
VLTLDIHQRADYILLRASGVLDLETSVTFQRRLAEFVQQDRRPVVVDLSGLQFLDSSGLGALVITLRLPEGRRPRIVLEPANRPVGRLLHAARMDQLLPIYPSVEAALAAPAARSAA